MKTIVKTSFIRIIVLLLAVCMIYSALSIATVSMGVYAEQYDTEAKSDEQKVHIMVSMGDSYSAGEGIEEFYYQNESISVKSTKSDWLAHRSKESWPGRLVIDDDGIPEKEKKDQSWYFVAASGAKTEHINNGFKKSWDYDGSTGSDYLAPQIRTLENLKANNQQVDYVTLTLGGNDADFGGIVANVVSPFNKSSLTDKLQKCWHDFYNESYDEYGYTVPSIRDRLKKAYNDIRDAAGEQAKIIVAGYPKLFRAGGDIWVGAFRITSDEIKKVNESVTAFNKEIRAIVNSCKSDGIRICFVSVEGKFEGHEAYADDPYINPVYLFERKSQDLKPVGLFNDDQASSYSVHPNAKGAEVYAECVQKKIKSIEKDNGKSEWPALASSDERDIVLVLDTSGSMDGEPIQQLTRAAEKFIDTVLDEDASIGVVAYDSSSLKLCDFCQDKKILKNRIDRLNADGSTNIEAGLHDAETMLDRSTARKKIIVLMSDGLPNVGLEGDYLVEYAKSIRDKGIYIYTLGFFSNITGSADEAKTLMKRIAGDEMFYYDIDDAESIVYFFGDIADQISGQQYIYIKIECPVDVTVKYNGETLSSKQSNLNTRTSFGSLTIEAENMDSDDDYESDNTDTAKILRLKSGVDYDIRIKGTGRGTMDYTIGFMDENGEYSDTRRFKNIKITKSTVIDTVAGEAEKTVLNVDEDGDGDYDLVYEAGKNGKGKLVQKSWVIYVVIGGVILLLAGGAVFIIRRKKQKTAVAINGFPVNK